MRKLKNILQFRSDRTNITKEEFEQLCLYIEFLTYESGCRSFSVTSPNKNEGKSTIASNIAYSLALSNKKVLLVDGNFINPGLHNLFKIKNTYGLTNCLVGQKTIFEVVNKTPLGNLVVITTGPIPTHSSNLLKLTQFDDFINTALKHFDYVIFDSPSVLEGDTAQTIGKKCDGAFLIIKQGYTRQSAAIDAKKMLNTANINILGVIFNKNRFKHI